MGKVNVYYIIEEEKLNFYGFVKKMVIMINIVKQLKSYIENHNYCAKR